MIKVECCGVTGYAISPKMNDRTIQELVVSSGNAVRSAFVDVAYSFSVDKLIKKLSSRQFLTAYIDHHLPHDSSLSFPSRLFEFTVLRERATAPSCCELVKTDEWRKNNVSTVFFHDDFDGFLSFVRGCGLTYPQIIEDVRKIDSGVGTERISNPGAMVINLLNFSYPDMDKLMRYDDVRTLCYEEIIEWFDSGKKSSLLQSLFSKSMELKHAATSRATYVANRCTRLISSRHDVVECDLKNTVFSLDNINLHILKQRVLRVYPNAKILAIISGTGRSTKVMILVLKRNGIDLKKIDQGSFGINVSGRGLIDLNLWPKFIRSWEESNF